jgi:hypothetical protein
MPQVKPKDKSLVQVWVSKALRKKLDRAAAYKEMTLSVYLRRLFQQHIERLPEFVVEPKRVSRAVDEAIGH